MARHCKPQPILTEGWSPHNSIHRWPLQTVHESYHYYRKNDLPICGADERPMYQLIEDVHPKLQCARCAELKELNTNATNQ